MSESLWVFTFMLYDLNTSVTVGFIGFNNYIVLYMEDGYLGYPGASTVTSQ